MVLTRHALYEITVKALLLDKDGRLFTLTSPDGYLDFPGGRVDEGEREIPWEEALRREVSEELGEGVRLRVGATAFVAKRRYDHGRQTHHVAAIYFVCKYLGGSPKLSDEHAAWTWVDPAELLTSTYKFVSEDEKHQMRTYFAGTVKQ